MQGTSSKTRTRTLSRTRRLTARISLLQAHVLQNDVAAKRFHGKLGLVDHFIKGISATDKASAVRLHHAYLASATHIPLAV